MLTTLFQQIDHLLNRNRQWWQFRPFHYLTSPWQESHPELYKKLRSLTVDELEELSTDKYALSRWLSPWLEDATELLALAKLPAHCQQEPYVNPRLAHSVPGRKWQQITAFAAYVPESGPLVEWCSGKGHLGRVLAANGHRVNCLERQAELCKEGEKLAERCGLDLTFNQVDVLTDNCARQLPGESHVVALHACGQLHTSLLKLIAQRKMTGLSLSPCCYHLVSGSHYQALSDQAKTSSLILDKADLQLPLQQTVTGGARIRRLRKREVIWRLAFDSLQRTVSDDNSYMPLPNVPKKLLSSGFNEFVSWACDTKQLKISKEVDPESFLDSGNKRFSEVARMELLQKLFQRPLELWLVLDGALFLEQHGYHVDVGTFCDYKLTPRNLLVSAHKPQST